MSTHRRAPPASHHLTDDCVHLVPRERSQGLGADIPGCGEAQESCRRGLVIRGFADQYNVIVPQGPVDVLDRDPAPTSRLLEGVVALRGVLRRADALVSEAREHDEARHGDPPAPRPATPEGTRILARIRRVADPIPQRRPSGKTTLTHAIKAGRLSASRREDGSYEIDPAELTRVYSIRTETPETVAQRVTRCTTPRRALLLVM